MRAWLTLSMALLLFRPASAEDQPPQRPIDPARRTKTVEVIDRCLASVVFIHTHSPSPKPGEEFVHEGSGSIIHPAGWVLTNSHVIKDMTRGFAKLHDGTRYPLTLVASFPHEDLALVKITREHGFKPIALGRSDDLLLGEPALSIGNPAGLMATASEGIVSGLRRSTTTEHASLPAMIQTSAAISGGNSGGPLINAVGQQIGVITSRKTDAENIAFAITIDRVRETLPWMIAAEQRGGFSLGLGVDSLASEARATSVATASPAAAADIHPGDVIERINGADVRQGIDFHVSLLEHKPGDQLTLDIRRGSERIATSVTLAPLRIAPPVDPAGLTAGLDFQAFEGRWSELPNFDELKPIGEGQAAQVSPDAFPQRKQFFGLVFNGYIQVPADGLYTFFVRSDDGSRLYIDDQLVVDNDGAHSKEEAAGLARLAGGLHGVRLAYFQGMSDAALELSYEGPNLSKRPVPSEALFRREE